MPGIRELRRDLAIHVRRAAAGERVVISIDGRPAAVLGPIGGDSTEVTLAALVASGALIPPRRADGHHPDGRVRVWSNVRFDRLLGEVRG